MSNTDEKAPINWHFASQLTHIYEHKKYNLTFLNNSDSYDKDDMQEKVDVLVRLHKAVQEKLKTASYSEPIQIFTLVPDKWSQIYRSE